MVGDRIITVNGESVTDGCALFVDSIKVAYGLSTELVVEKRTQANPDDSGA